jgi:predicted nucleotidyltransferase component of viral defense system
VKNIAHSVKVRLQNEAARMKISFNQVLLLYMQERLLYRLSKSEQRERFVLKGGLLLFGVYGLTARPTQDIDFLGRLPNNEMEMIRAFQEIAVVTCPEDGLVFDPDALEIETIQAEMEYPGWRISIIGRLGKAVIKLKLDIGFGDALVPEPRRMDFPTLLEGTPVPEIVCYCMETVIAEKLHAMVRHEYTNSRMKDFFDIYLLSGEFDFDGRTLQEAIHQVFVRRNTTIQSELFLFTDDFSGDSVKRNQWAIFMARSLIGVEPIPFPQAMAAIKVFLHPVWEAIRTGAEFSKDWTAGGQKWGKR